MTENIFRGRRLRQNLAIRNLCRQTGQVEKSRLVMPYFVDEIGERKKKIEAMPGQWRWNIDGLVEHLGRYVELGLAAVLLFGIPKDKNPQATGAYAEDGVVQKAIRAIKKNYPGLLVITDVCLCEYMSHGHCGILEADGTVNNDATLPLLVKTALSHAKAGSDIVAPSDMMDGRIAAIRRGLDENNFINVPILSYAVKYASAYYGPFREAAESSPICGDRKAYQMDPGNSREALAEAESDISQGADMLIVKPAGPYGDIISLVRRHVNVPIAAYQVSGEYSMIRAAALNGWINEAAVVMESLIGLKRAGADILITYFAEMVLEEGWAV